MSDKKRIKTEIRKQLKASIPTWNRLSKQTKKELCQSVINKVILQYNEGTLPSSEDYEQLQLHPIPAGVMSLADMKDFVSYMSRTVFTFPCPDKNRYLSAELRAIDQLLDDRILNSLLAPPSYTPSKREKTPAMLFRAELLKSLYYAEMSYRKFCSLEINDRERKRNRVFIGLDCRRTEKIHHTELSLFRSSLTWKQQLNLLVYFAMHFFDSSLGAGSFYYGLDSTDLAAKMNTHPVATVTVRINGKKETISVYSHLDTECGERRKKSDRSSFYVGYKIHTLTVLNPLTGKAYPLLPVVTGANHHDSNYLKPLGALGKALGLDIRLIVADQAYDAFDLSEHPDVTLISKARTTVVPPHNVEVQDKNVSVYCHDYCEREMTWVGRLDGKHEYHCSALSGQCSFEMSCPRSRVIPQDNGYFGHIPWTEGWIGNIEKTRKHCERPFNLIKHRNGTDRIGVLSIDTTQVIETIATIAVICIEIVSSKQCKKKRKKQYTIPLTA